MDKMPDDELWDLKSDPEYAREYVRAAMDRSPSEMMMALRHLADAYGGMAKIAESSGLQRESIYRILQPKGNPSLKTLVAILHAFGMRLTVKID